MSNEKFKVKFGLAVGDTSATIDATTGDIVTNGDITVGGNDIKGSGGTTAITMNSGNVAVAGDLTVNGNDIRGFGGATALTINGADVAVAGDLTVTGNDIKSSTATALTLSGADVRVANDLTVGGNDIKTSDGTLALTFFNGSGNVSVNGDLNVTGGDITTTSTGIATVFDTTATSVYIGGGASSVVLGAPTTSLTTVSGDLQVSGNDIKSSAGTVALTLNTTDVTVAGDLTVAGNDIKSSTATALTLSGADVTVAGDLAITGGDITTSAATGTLFNTSTTTIDIGGDATDITMGKGGVGSLVTVKGMLSADDIDSNGVVQATGNVVAGYASATQSTLYSNGNATIAGDLTVIGNDIKGNGGATAITMSGANVILAGDLRIDGGDITGVTATANIFNVSPTTTLNIGGTATTVSIGANTGTTTINNDLVADSVSVGGNLIATKGVYAKGIMDATFTDGVVIDYTTGTARISTGAADGLTIYNGGVANTALLALDSSGNAALTGDLTVNGNDIRGFGGATALTLSSADVAVAGDLTVSGNDIKSNGGTIALTLSGANVSTPGSSSAAYSMATGGAVLTGGVVNTFATLGATGTVSGSTSTLGVRAENVTTGYGASNIIVDHGQNRAGGTATTSGSPVFSFESTRGTSTTPTATGANDTLGVVQFAGHDGVRGLGSQINGSSVQIIGQAASAYTNDGTYTTNAGANLLVRTQPTNMRLTSNSRQALFFQNYTTVAGAPPTQNVLWNSSSMTTQYDNTGTTYNGTGKQAHTFYHPTFNIYGVPSQSTANVDNNSLLGTNTLSFYANRQSGWSGRRDAVQSGDTLAQVNVFGQTGTDSTGNGSQTGILDWTALENFSGSARGSRFRVATGDIGANTLTDRMTLDSGSAIFNSTKTYYQHSTAAATKGGEITMKAGILNGATDYDKTTELSVTALTLDGTRNATYETKTLRFNGTNYSPTVNGDLLGRFTFLGNYSSGTSPSISGASGYITVAAAEDFTSGASGAGMKFNVTKVGTNTSIEALDLQSNQSVLRSDKITIEDTSGADYLYADSILTNLMSPTGHLNISGEFTHINRISTNTVGIVLEPGPQVPVGGDYTEMTMSTHRNPAIAGPNDYSSMNFATYNTTDGVNFTPTQSGDIIGQYKFNGNANTSTSPGVPGGPAATIQVQATENWSGTGTGAKIKFSVIGNGDTNGTDVIMASPDGTTFQADTISLNSSTGSALTGNKINYNRVYGQWQYDATITPAAANTAYAYPIANGTVDFASVASVANTSQIIPGALGFYKMQFSVQLDNADNGSEHTAYIWWRKNGTDVPGSMGRVGVPKAGATIAGWDNTIEVTNVSDYWELMYAVDSTQVTLPYYAATAFGPATASMFITLVPVGM